MDLDKNEAAALSRLFSAAVLRDFSKHAGSPLFARLLLLTRLSTSLPPEATVGTALDQAFGLLRRSKFRDDYVYRAAITEKILLGRHNLNTATLLSEVRAGSCKADIVVLNGTSTAYEIKSERDSLSRLRSQVKNYCQVFAAVNVVVSTRHLAKVFEAIPEDVGIITLSERYTLQTTRPPQNKPERVNPTKILDILRVDEAKSILSRLGQEVPDVPNTEIRSELRRIFATMEPTVVHDESVKTLKTSRSQARLASFISSVPGSIRAAALAASPTPNNRVRIKEAVETPLTEALTWI
ncbi:sce7726 family protein [uncultured Tessaracoccus sp.]|uniref:sce7726 family protein n=1 Tax=uncultured Tessaracoccus sp. TaxID=905023 RepID=UPI0026267870|nr:sce7726 family protein [uncultured Tessaracoccus sp.]